MSMDTHACCRTLAKVYIHLPNSCKLLSLINLIPNLSVTVTILVQILGAMHELYLHLQTNPAKLLALLKH